MWLAISLTLIALTVLGLLVWFISKSVEAEADNDELEGVLKSVKKAKKLRRAWRDSPERRKLRK